MDMENEYEVETILKAKVFMRGKKMGWKFFVKWKGYQDADNTWEPFKSFENSGEEVIKRFWDRIDTKDRDVNSVEGWTNGEEVFPTGPPRGRRRKDSSLPGKDKLTSLVDGATKREKRPLQSPASASPSKRKRASSSRRRSDTQLAQRARLESHTPVPDSQSEDEQLLIGSLPRPVSNGNLAGDRSPRLEEPPEVEISVSPGEQTRFQKSKRRGRPPKSSQRFSDHVKAQSSMTHYETKNSLLPSGQCVEANTPQEPAAALQTFGINTRRAGLKGRDASLLSYKKGKGVLKTLRRRRTVKEDEAAQDAEEVLELLESASAPLGSAIYRSGSSSVEIPPQGEDVAPTAAELLTLANYDQTESHTLPDYEEQTQPNPANATFELPDKMPTSISFPEPLSGGPSPWRRTTIFGPLAIGSGLQTWLTSSTPDAGVPSPLIPKPFLLSLDNSTSIPVTLKDISSTQTINSLHLESIVSGIPGPPGKLYTSHAAAGLLETLETGGSCARLIPGDIATAEQRRVFDVFCSKLEEGGLFVVMASSEVLACCSSTNEDYTKKLALTTSLQGLSETVVVSHVKVVNYSAFADAAAHAENVRW